MFTGTANRLGNVVRVSTVVGVGAALVALAPPAAALHQEQYVEVPQCQPATGQDCPQRPEVKFTGDEKSIVLQFTTNANGCSDALFRFNVDNYPQTDWIRASPNQTISADIGIHQGPHVLSVSARGIEGGCNTGILNAWGGTVHLDTVDDVGPAPQKVTPPPCKWGYRGAMNINQGRDLRLTLDSWNGMYAIGPPRLYKANSTVLLDNGQMISASGEGTDASFTIAFRDLRGNYWNTFDYVGHIDTDTGTLRGTATDNGGATTDWVAQEFFTCA